MASPADPRDADRYLRLSQFLELHSRWMGTTDAGELGHRIRQTVGLMLASEDVDLVLVAGAGAYTGYGAIPPPHSSRPLRETGMVGRAMATMLPQLHGDGSHAVGVFPFSAATGVRGYMRIRIARPLFEGSEVAFLRFVSSLAGVLLATAPAPFPEPLVQGPVRPGDDESDARRYVAMAVHDLRNPLNVISGYGGLLADGSLGVLSDEQREAVEAINRQLGGLLGLIDRLIDFDRLARAETTVTASRFCVRELFDEIRQRCFAGDPTRVSWPEEEATFDFVTDRRRLFAIVQNLVDNALRHSGSESVAVRCWRRDGRLIITVTDAGPGLPAGLEAALSDRHSCERLRERGTGIGLYTVACYVKVLGGRLEVRSPSDAGTEFCVSLPALAAQAADAAA